MRQLSRLIAPVCASLVLVCLLAQTYSNRVAAQGALHEFAATVSATATSSSTPFGFVARDVLVINDGSNEIFVSFASTTATTSKLKVNSGESIGVTFAPDSGSSGVAIICSTAETATVRVGAWR